MPLNRKAQIFTWDIILATVIFLVVLGTIIFLWTDTLGDIDSTDTQYEIQWLATAVSEQMARTPGSPANWTYAPNTGNITVLGLAATRTIGNDTETLDRVLDPDKVVSLIDLSQNNYVSMRNKLFGTGRYDYYMELSCLDPTVLDCFEGLKFNNTANADRNVTCEASNTTFYITNYTLRSDQYLAGIWRFDEGAGSTAADGSANGNDATIYGATWTSGKYKNALRFNGSNNYVSVTSSDSLNSPSASNQVTVSAWIYPTSSAQQMVVSKDTGNGALGAGSVYMLELESNGQIRFHIHNTTDGDIINLINGSYTLNTWQFVVGTFNGSVGTLYVNGTLTAFQNSSGGSIYSGSTQNLFIGTLRNTARFFNGTIDEVKLWSRALSVDEVRQEYARGKKYCRFGNNASIQNVSYQLYDTKTVNFRNSADEAIFDDDTTFLKSTANLKVVIYEQSEV